MTRCRLHYDLDGWSLVYRYASGTGEIRCENGQTSSVRLTAHGGGATLGTQKVIDGRGVFSGVADIGDLYGTYAEVGAHAGGGGSVDARAMMKGNVNLSLSGTGQGISLGFAVGGFSIQPR